MSIMSTTKRLGLLLVVLIALAFVSNLASNIRFSDLSTFFSNLGNIKEVVKTENVVSEDKTVTDIVDKVSLAVLSVSEKSVSYDLLSGPVSSESSIGTGFAVSTDLVITNKHVVPDATSSYVVVDNKGKRFTSVQIFRDPLNDLAIIKVAGADFAPLVLGDSDKIKVGQTVLAFGNALGQFSNSVTKGIISGLGRGITAQSGVFGQAESLDNVIQTDAALNPGNSGGPLVDLNGEAIGINVAISSQGENIGFAIPINKVKELVDNFKAHNKIVRPLLGVNYVMVNQALATERGLAVGAFVSNVVAGSAAEEAGVKANDIVTEVDGVKVNDTSPLYKILNGKKVGDKVSLTIWRNGNIVRLSATLKEASSS